MRRTKRFASFALAACMGVSLLVNVPVGTVSAAEPDKVVTAEATETDAKLKTGEDTELEQTEMVVADTAETSETDFEWDGTKITKYKGNGGDVVIPSRCTEIGSLAFSAALDGYSNLTSVVIPNSVTTIGDSAFYGCSNLTDIIIPDSVTKIERNVFHGCSSLTSITIPDSVIKIGGMLFHGCSSLTSIEVASGNTIYDSRENCNAIIETKTNTLIAGCKNTKIPNSVTGIGAYAFICSGLTSITIPASVTKIGDGVFQGCSNLKSIIISEGVTEIGSEAFVSCSNLTSITIPASVTKIGTWNNLFQSCNSLTHIEIAGGNTVYDSRENCNAIIETKTNTLISGCKNTTIPSSVTKIGQGAFFYCGGLTSIVIPAGVTEIGDATFWGCKNLTSVSLPNSLIKIGGDAFRECESLTSITIPKGVTEIGYCAFNSCSSLASVTIPESVTKIGDFAFAYCDNLKTIYGITGSYAETYAKENGYTFKAIEKPVTYVTTSYRTHVQKDGWQKPVTNGTMSGTSGQAKRLEGIEISVSGNKNLGIQYSTHCQTYGWLPWSANGEMNGTTGEAKRLEAIKIQLTGADKDKYDVYYRVHAQSYGWLGWAKNGEPSGTAGYAKRLEGIQIVVVKKDGKNTSKAPGLDYAGISASKGKHDNRAYIAKTNGTITIPGSTDSTNIMYKTHVQSFGWQNWVLNGTMSGTSGKAKRLEGINIKLSNAAYAGGIQYRTHVQTYGWEKEWKKDGAMSGTSGEAKRLEAIQIKLYGEMANRFDVYYRVHAQSYGWLGWAKNGEEAGTAGFAKRLEGIQIVLVPKGGTAPANNYKNIQSVNTKAYIKK